MNRDRAPANRVRAQAFGTDAAAYDRFRPPYPPALIEDLLSGHPRTALDIGCGTGKAARLLLDRGVRVLGVEVDQRMADVARGHGITIETTSLENWTAHGRHFDLIYSAQAWHWVDASKGLPIVAAALGASGRLALFWNFAELPPSIDAQVEHVYEQTELSRASVLRGGGPATLDQHVRDLDASGLFTPVEHREHEWYVDYSRDGWLGLIATHSDHSTLPPVQLAQILDEIGRIIDAAGGAIAVKYRTLAMFTGSRPAD